MNHLLFYYQIININGFEALPQLKKRPAQVLFIPKLISEAVACHVHLEIWNEKFFF
jgi:hypothetical protein